MGHAFHRKQSISLERTHTRGIGIRYVNNERPIPEPTPERLAAKEAQAQKQAAREASNAAYNERFAALVGIAEVILNRWKEITDGNDYCLATFPGWTKGDLCLLPVDPGTAGFYAEHVRLFMNDAARVGRSPSLADLDNMFAFVVRRDVSTAQVVVDALAAIKSIGRDCVDSTGFDVARFVQKLARRGNRDKQRTEDIDGALGYVSRQLVAVLRHQE
jgi:hypothetical protein